MSSAPKEIIFEQDARQALLAGIRQLANVVACTLGPKGRNVGLEQGWGAPKITNDGDSIVKFIQLKDRRENLGVSMAQEVAAKTKEKCGDGTTSGTLFLHALVESGMRCIEAGASPINIKRGMDKAIAAVVEALNQMSTPIEGYEAIRNIAMVAASGNMEIGTYIADAITKAGTGGVVTIEEGKGTETTIEDVKGMQFDRGYSSPYFCTNMEKMIIEMERPLILVTDKKINNIHDLLPILQTIASTGRSLLIIAEDVEGDALSTLVINRLRGILKVAAVKAPGFGDAKKALLQDIAIITGSTLISEEAGLTLKETQQSQLGSAERIHITKEHTTIVDGIGDAGQIQARIHQIDQELAKATSSYDRDKLLTRKAKLAGGVAVIRVGAATEPEAKQRKQACEDSLNSTRAAIEEGVVPGGGIALLRASRAIDALDLTDEEAMGADCVKTACAAPLIQIVSNAGYEGPVIAALVQKADGAMGFNAATGAIEDLAKARIMDPRKVVNTYVTCAASVAGIIILSEALIVDAEIEDEAEEA